MLCVERWRNKSDRKSQRGRERKMIQRGMIYASLSSESTASKEQYLRSLRTWTGIQVLRIGFRLNSLGREAAKLAVRIAPWIDEPEK